MSKRNLLLLLVLGVMLYLVSCGGGSSVTPDPVVNPDPPAGNPQTFDDWSANTTIPETPKSYRGIPVIPNDADHQSSEAGNLTVLGKDAMDFSQCQVDGDAMLINAGAAADTNPADIPAWALYKVAGLNEMDPLSLNVECVPGGLGQQYSVAVADYSVLDWRWFGPTGLPEVQIDLTESGHTYITNLGNLYFLVVCYDTNTATHHQSTVVAQEAAGEVLPGAPAELVASKGEIADGVGLVWLAGAGADSYEVYRQGAFWRYDDNDPPPSDFDPGFNPENDEWVLIGTSETTQYLDEDVLPGVVYMYKVRSVNEIGASAFSNIDEGWAFNDWEPPFEGIHGYVFGNEWGYLDDGDPPPGDFEPSFDPNGDPIRGGSCCPGPCPGVLPLAGATVSLMTFDPVTGQLGTVAYSATTGVDGFYQFLEVDPGEYLLTAVMDGWYFCEEFWVSVEGEIQPMQFDFYGWPGEAPPPWEPPAGLTGYVWGDPMTESGGPPQFRPGDGGQCCPILPLEGAVVRVLDPETGTEILNTTTNADGFYQIFELPVGFYQLTCELEGWYFEPESHWFDIPEGPMPGLAFDFFGRPEGYQPPPLPDGISGRVWDVSGYLGNGTDPGQPMPLAGVLITVTNVEDGSFSATVETDVDGYYNIPELPLGMYDVSATLAGYWFDPPSIPVDYTQEVYSVQADFWGYDGSEPRPGPWPPEPREGIYGVVFNAELFDPAGCFGGPMAGVEVTVSDLDTGVVIATMTTGEDGTFYFPLADLNGGGVFAVSAAQEGYWFDPEEHHVYLTGALMYADLEFWGYPIGSEYRPPRGILN